MLNEFDLVVDLVFDFLYFDFGQLYLVVQVEQPIKRYSLFDKLHDGSRRQNTSVLVDTKLFLVLYFLVVFHFVVEFIKDVLLRRLNAIPI